MTITEDDIDTLRHMVGANGKAKDRGYRNYFATDASDPQMARLIEQGLATAGRRQHKAMGGMAYFHATRLGCKVAGLTEKETDRAFED